MVKSISSCLISKGDDAGPDTALEMLSDHRIAMSFPSTSTRADLPIVCKIHSFRLLFDRDCILQIV